MRSVCIQFQPDRVTADEARVRKAFREAFPDAKVIIGEDDGRYENILFEVASPDDAMSKVLVVLDSPEVGRAARSSCIVTCQGEHGWDDYLLLHHLDRTLALDAPAAQSAEEPAAEVNAMAKRTSKKSAKVTETAAAKRVAGSFGEANGSVTKSLFVGYVGDADFHDGSVLEIEQQGETVRVRVQGASGRVFVVDFGGVHAVRANRPEGMLLYALTELSAEPPLRRFVFANWDDDNTAYLEVAAETIAVRKE